MKRALSPSFGALRGALVVALTSLCLVAIQTGCRRDDTASKKSVAPPEAITRPTPVVAPTVDRSLAAQPQLDAKQRAVVGATNAHVLLLPDDKRLKASFLTGGADWYTASVSLPGLTIVIEGKATAKNHPEITAEFPATPPSLSKPRIARNELIVEAAFIHAGTSFSVEVECALPSRDKRCTEDAYILELVKQLQHVQAPATKPSAPLKRGAATVGAG